MFLCSFDLLTPKMTLKLKFDLVRPTYCNLGVPKTFNSMKFSVRALLDPHISRFISIVFAFFRMYWSHREGSFQHAKFP